MTTIRKVLVLSLLAACTEEASAPPDPGVLAAPSPTATCGSGTVDPGELCLGVSGIVLSTPPANTVLAADVNADGRADLVATTANPPRSYVRLGTGTGFGAWSWWQAPAGVFTDVAAGDFDGDGDLDLAIADQANDRVLVRLNQGGVAFTAGIAYPAGDAPRRVLAAHLNGDARADLVTLDHGAGTATVRLAAAGGFGPAVTYPVGDAEDLALGDCDGDRRLDLIYVNGNGTHATLRARRNHGGAFAAPLVSGLPLYDAEYGYMDPYAIVAADLDDDGVADVAVSAEFSRLPTATSDGDCTFTPAYDPFTIGTTYAYSFRLRTADMDADGALDVLAPHGPVGDVLSVKFGLGDGTLPLGHHLDMPIGSGPRDLAIADFTGDGALDAVASTAQGLLLLRSVP